MRRAAGRWRLYNLAFGCDAVGDGFPINRFSDLRPETRWSDGTGDPSPTYCLRRKVLFALRRVLLLRSFILPSAEFYSRIARVNKAIAVRFAAIIATAGRHPQHLRSKYITARRAISLLPQGKNITPTQSEYHCAARQRSAVPPSPLPSPRPLHVSLTSTRFLCDLLNI